MARGSWRSGPTGTFPHAGATLFEWALVKVSSTGTLVVCGAGEEHDGVIRNYDSNATYATMEVRRNDGNTTRLGKADAAITSGVLVYAGALGTISATVLGLPVGRALEAATAAGDEIEYIPFVGAAAGILPLYPTASLPAAAAALNGLTVYDTTVDKVKTVVAGAWVIVGTQS